MDELFKDDFLSRLFGGEGLRVATVALCFFLSRLFGGEALHRGFCCVVLFLSRLFGGEGFRRRISFC